MAAHVVRPSTPSDAEFLYRVSEEHFRPLVEALGRKWASAGMREKCKQDAASGRTSIVEVNGQSAGFLTFERRSTEIWLESLVLAPEFRRRGIGDALVSELKRQADAQRIRMRLGVLVGNPARAYWERHGFKVIGEFDKQHVLMERTS